MTLHAEDLRRYLADVTGRPVVLRMNDNQHRVISANRIGATPGIRVSLHRMFLEADAPTLEALAAFIVRPTPANRGVVRTFIAAHEHLLGTHVPTRPPRPPAGTPRGRVFHLRHRADALNGHYFAGNLDFRIIWGRSVRGGRHQRHVTLGTWNRLQRTIRIHRMLDHPHVPPYYIDFVIYHEMVHIVVPSEACGGGRLVHHSLEFRDLERQFGCYEAAVAWEKRWMSRLIRAWNGGAELPPEAARVSHPRACAGFPGHLSSS